MRIALIASSSSGSADPDQVERLLRANGAEVDCFAPGEANAAVRSAPDRIVVASGDGLIADTAVAAGAAGIPLAIVPSGTANDFARSLGIPDDREGACQLAAAAEPRLRAIDMAWCDDAPFVNVASLGLSVAALRRAERVKSLLGAVAYPAAALRVALTAGATRCLITVDDAEVFSGEAWQVLIANSGAFGGGASIDAAADDARLALVVLERGPRLRLARHAWGLRGGNLNEQPGVHDARGRMITVTLMSRAHARTREVNCDGDLVPVGEHVRFRIDGHAFNLVVPSS